MASSSLFSSSTLENKYDVFISFRGADIRNGFLSHLLQAFRQNQIIAFVDEKLERGKEISLSVSKIIEQSYASIVIFTENYAYSSWCLDELVKINECYKKMEQIVFPIFYHVDPNHVQELNGSFGDAIDKHRQEALLGRRSCCLEKMEDWCHALTEISNLSGWDSRKIKPDSKLIEEVVSQIVLKLKYATPINVYNNGLLVGIDSRVNNVKSLLCLESVEVGAVGIWGMGGVGKTTIAQQVFNQICSQFQHKCFAMNIREKAEKMGKGEILSAILDNENLNAGGSLRMLSQKKVLIVLDDVSDLDEIEFMVGTFASYSCGSRIIVTSRDKQLLKNMDAKIYEVEKLNDTEALHLFSISAFKQSHPKEEYMELSRVAIKYASGIPLALKVIGSNLYGKSIEEWASELQKLESICEKKIQKILRSSFDGLDGKEKEIFLDIACFFKGHPKDSVIKLLDGCGFYATCGISHLNDKSLVTISSNNTLEMHGLLQQMGKDIVCEKKELGKRTRLWDPKDIYKVLTNGTGTKSIECISLDMSKIGSVELSSTAFVKMYNLRFLNFYIGFCGKNRVFLPKGLEYLPNELRFLYWDEFPMESFPLIFFPENLVQLHMRGSKLKQLWIENQCTLGNLRLIDLSWSVNLISIPDLSTATKLEVLSLQKCTSLIEIPSSIKNLTNLTLLNLRDCINLCKLPSCFPKSLTKFYLCGTAIKQLPSSIGCLSRLNELSLVSCKEVESIPNSFGELKSLKTLDLSKCSKLTSLPDKICNMKNLLHLWLVDCVNLNGLPEKLGDLEYLVKLDASRSGIKLLPSSINQLRRLILVELNYCHMSEFPVELCSITSMVSLHLQGNDFEMIPARFKQLSQLETLDLSDCKRLKYLPELPSSLCDLFATNCTSLELASLSFLLTEDRNQKYRWQQLSFINCINLNQVARNQMMDNFLLTHQDHLSWKMLCIAGNDIVKGMKYQNNNGSSLCFRLDRHDLNRVCFCVVVASKAYPHKGLFCIGCIARFTDESGLINAKDFRLLGYESVHEDIHSEHVCFWCNPLILDFDSQNCFTKVSFEFYVENFGIQDEDDDDDDKLMIVKCGVHPIFNIENKRKNHHDEKRMEEEEQPSYKRSKRPAYRYFT